ncbi:DNA-binding IclR family transcriptional regulator [Rhizobium binae]|uniref:DNA-binding IclR family transcriptional regulator n=1 Tax=Rhizobium binae TaxID=1138190 RepID=A0ABV2MG57_9HYPH
MARTTDLHRRGAPGEREGLFIFNSIVDSFTHCFAVPVRGEEGHAAATLCLVTPRGDRA